MTTPRFEPIDFDAGTDFEKSFVLKNEFDEEYDLTGSTAHAQLRHEHYAANSVDFATSIEGSTVTISLTPDDTSSLRDGRYVYDVLLVSESNTVSKAIWGYATVRATATEL